jgi:hypothetical protein
MPVWGKLFAFFVNRASLWRSLVLVFTYALNLLILSTWGAPVDFSDPNPVVPTWYGLLNDIIRSVCEGGGGGGGGRGGG